MVKEREKGQCEGGMGLSAILRNRRSQAINIKVNCTLVHAPAFFSHKNRMGKDDDEVVSSRRRGELGFTAQVRCTC